MDRGMDRGMGPKRIQLGKSGIKFIALNSKEKNYRNYKNAVLG